MLLRLPNLAAFLCLALAISPPVVAGDFVLVPVALSGDSAPGGERRYVSFSQGRLNDLGQIAFAGRTEVGEGADFLGVWFGRPGALRLSGRELHAQQPERSGSVGHRRPSRRKPGAGRTCFQRNEQPELQQ